MSSSSRPAYFGACVPITESVAVDTDDYASDCEDSPMCGCQSRNGEKCCVDNTCPNVQMLMECVQCSPRCGNQRIRKQQYAKLVVRETPGKGHGLFVEEDVPAGTFLTEYVGELISHKEFSRRLQQRKNEPMMFIMQIKSNAYLDAREKGSVSRFINHSCEPNSSTDMWIVQGRIRVGIFTTKALTAGTELSFDYRWRRSATRPPTKCLCLAPSCRGYIELPGPPVASLAPARKGLWLRPEDAARVYYHEMNPPAPDPAAAAAASSANESKGSSDNLGSSLDDDRDGMDVDGESKPAALPPIKLGDIPDSAVAPFLQRGPDQDAFGFWLVGKRVRILWPKMQQAYECNIVSFDPANRKHKVFYVGDETTLEEALFAFSSK